MMNRGVVAIQGDVTYLNDTATTLFSLPAGATPLFAVVQVATAFNDSGTDLVDFGVPGTADAFASDVDVSATGSFLVTLANANLTGPTAFTATYIGANSDATAGRLTVTVVYATPFELL